MYLSPVILPASPTCPLLSTAATACSEEERAMRDTNQTKPGARC
jgi:hypothetical protein